MMLRRLLPKHRRRFGGLRDDERGAEIIEFAIVSILFLMLAFGVMEFGRAIWMYGTVAHAAREGARFAIVRGSDSGRTAVPADVTSHVAQIAGGMTGLTVTTTWDDPAKDPGSVVQVQVDKDFQPALPIVNLGSFTLSSTSRMVIAF